MLQDINWGIIGCGNVTELKSGPAFQKVPHSSLVAVMRRNATLAMDYAMRHRVPAYYSDAADLINNRDVNAVYVATPPDSHARYAIQAMRAGKPVYVEKPMARTYAECREMIRVSEETGVPLYVAYYRRTLPAFVQVKEWVDEGKIGQVLSVNIRLFRAFAERDRLPDTQTWHVNPDIAGAGHFYDLASHQLDYLDFLFGPVEEVYGMAANRAGFYRAEDTVTACFRFQSGVIGSGNWCFVSDCEADCIEIVGTLGRISMPCFDKGPVIVETKHETGEYNFQNPENISGNLIAQVVGALRGESACVSTMYSAARTGWVLQEIVKSYYDLPTGGARPTELFK